MPWVNELGSKLEWPLKLRTKIIKSKKLNLDEVIEVLDAAQKIFHEAQRMDVEIITLRKEVDRLTHENEFMLRMIDSGTKDKNS